MLRTVLKNDFVDLYAFRAMIKHLEGISKGITVEKRSREQRRVKIALRTIHKWQKQGEDLFESLRCSEREVTVKA